MKPLSLGDRLRNLFKRKKEPEANRPDPAKYSPCDPIAKANEYKLLLGNPPTIVVFRNGTCIFSDKPATREEAVELMKAEGPVVHGSRKADFYVGKTKEPLPGTIVRYHHPNIISFVNETEYSLTCPDHVVGVMVRMARHCDSSDLHVGYFESA